MLLANIQAQAQYDTLLGGDFAADRVYDDSQRREIPSAVLVWEESVSRRADGSYVISSTTPFGFTSMVVLWELEDAVYHTEDFNIRYRVHRVGEGWSDYAQSEGAYHSGEVPRGLYVSELIMMSDTRLHDAFELVVIPPGGANLTRIEVDIIDITGSGDDRSEIHQYEAPDTKTRSGIEFPPYVPRSSWCVTSACLNPTYTVNYIDATHTLIHYGAAPANYENGAAVVASYWDYHVNTNGWFDIGYNYLVDKHGHLYEGRHNPELPFDDVRAAHAGASNAVSIGINFLGNTDAPALHPTAVQLDKNVQLLSWWYDYNGYDPTTAADIILQDPAGEIEERFRISGHRDVGNTFCPGNVLYAMLPGMREEVLDAMQSNIYSIGPESVDGESENFPTFREAVTFLNATEEFTSDLVFYITGDLVEDGTTSGIGLAVDPGEFSITFKPAPGTSPTLAFNYPGDVNAGPSGAFILGISHENNIAWADAATTRNIIFDGSNTEGGTTRDLTITNTSGSHRNALPFLMVGDVSDITIKNLNLYHQATNQSSPTQVGFNGALAFRVNHNVAENNAPHNIFVDNCHISADFPGVSPGYNGVNVFSTASGATGYVHNISISNSLIEGKANGMYLAWSGNQINISNNEIRVNQDTGVGILGNAGLQFPLGMADANITINANLFSKVSFPGTVANANMAAIDILTGGNYTISNNMISGFEITGTGGYAGSLRGLRISNTAADVLLAYNTLLLDELPGVSGATVLEYKALELVFGNLTMKNNIIVAHEDAFAFNLLELSELPLSMDHNLYYLAFANNAGLVSYDGSEYDDLDSWQTASGLDGNSLFDDPMFVSESDLKIQEGSPAQAGGTPLAEVTEDMFGTSRHQTHPSIGAHENQPGSTLRIVLFDVIDEFGLMIDHAIITLGETTNEPGNYEFVKFPGTYDYNVTAEGYFSQSGTVEVGDSDVYVMIMLEEGEDEPAHAVTFDVLYADGTPVSDAVVTLGGITNEAGDYVFENLAAGTYAYTVSKLCYAEVVDEVTVNTDLLLEVTLNMSYHPGDANGDGSVNVLDVILMANYFAGNEPAAFCFENADVNGDGVINILDIITTINIFASGDRLFFRVGRR